MDRDLPRGGWRFWRIPAYIAAALAIVAAAVPLLVPVSSLIPRISAVAAEKLGQPVSIEELHLFLLPTPRVVAKGIVVGKAREAVVEELEIVPELLSLLSGPTTIRLVRAEHVALNEAALAIPAGMPKSAGDAPSAALQVRRIEL